MMSVGSIPYDLQSGQVSLSRGPQILGATGLRAAGELSHFVVPCLLEDWLGCLSLLLQS